MFSHGATAFTAQNREGKRGAKPSGGECSTQPVGRPRAANVLAESNSIFSCSEVDHHKISASEARATEFNRS